MARIRVKVINNNKFAKQQLDFIKVVSDRQLNEIAEKTSDEMKVQISASITRSGSTGNLENSIFSEKIIDGYGVGNIPFLNANAPYWRHVNFGSLAIGASHSHRVPLGGFSPGLSAPSAGANTGRWVEGADSFSFRPTKPIAPRNYIAKTVQQIPRIVASVIRRGIL